MKTMSLSFVAQMVGRSYLTASYGAIVCLRTAFDECNFSLCSVLQKSQEDGFTLALAEDGPKPSLNWVSETNEPEVPTGFVSSASLSLDRVLS